MEEELIILKGNNGFYLLKVNDFKKRNIVSTYFLPLDPKLTTINADNPDDEHINHPTEIA